MDLTHRFTVPSTIEDTWERFQDIGELAQCFPGAQVTSVEGDTFEGTVKVKLGPIALVYAGSGTFVAKDEAAHTFQVDAKGRDKRGNGTAGAKVGVTMTPDGPDGTGTAVEVITDLAITGKPAQFGRGVMQDVSDKLLGQFVACLEQRIGAEEGQEPVAEGTGGGAHAADVPADSAPTPPRATAPTPPATPAPAAADDAIDLGGALLPVLMRRYAKYAVAGVAVLLVLRMLRRRRRG